MAATLFTNIAVFDGSGSALAPGEVLVDGNRIAAVAGGAGRIDRARAAEIVDGGGNTLMPGLIEAHAHLTFPSAVDRIVKQFMPPAERHQFYAAHNAKILLDHGFTAAYSGGATRPAVEVALRDEIRAGYLPGPRLKASSFERTVGGDRVGYAAGVEAARQFAKEMIDLGVDCMKLVLSGRGATEPEHWQQINYDDDELAAVSQMARDAGVSLTCHAYMPAAVKQAVRHGFRALYHCNFADDEALDMIEARKSELFVAPAVGILMADAYDRFPTREEAAAIGTFEALDGQRKVIPELRKRGVRVLPGGDYGFPWNPNGRNARDLALFVSEFGYAPAEALRAATMHGAELLGMGDELGLIKEGYLADLILVAGDPVRDIALLQRRDNILMIMQDGKYHRRPAQSGASAGRAAAE